MVRRLMFGIAFFTSLFIFSCSRKNHPSGTIAPGTEKNNAMNEKKSDSVVVTKPLIKRKEKIPVAKVIIVNDSAAHRSIDGRYYYDVMGHRYWKNNKDGKYYLFNKSMYNNPDFKAN